MIGRRSKYWAGGLGVLLLLATPRAEAVPSHVPAAGSVREAVAVSLQASAARSTALDLPDDWDWAASGEMAPDDGKKSVLRAVASSAVLPGLGESYLEHPNRAKLFWTIEGVIWSSFAFYRIQAERRQDQQVEYASLESGAPTDGDADYYEHIGLWISIEEWYDIVRRDARFTYPDDPAAQDAYFEQNKRYGDGDAWSWPSDTERLQYRRLRSRAERSFRNARAAAGAALFNRLGSMIHSLALGRNYNHHVEQARLELRVQPIDSVDGLVIGPVLTSRY